jgi:fucose permease
VKTFALLLAFLAFIALGIPDGLLGVAWPFIRQDFSLPLDALGGLLLASMSGYIFSSFISGYSLKKFGLGRLLTFSCWLTALALIGYTVVPIWVLMLPFGFISGFGAGGIDAGLNGYFEKHHGEQLMQWLHASFGIGVTVGPFVMTWAITGPQQWRIGYWIIGVFQLTVGLIFFAHRNIWNDDQSRSAQDHDKEHSKEQPNESVPLVNQSELNPKLVTSLSNLSTWISGLLFFFYVGLEITMGHWAFSFLTQAKSMTDGFAGVWTGFYWASFTLGRIGAGFIAYRVSPKRLIQGSIGLAVTSTILLLFAQQSWILGISIGFYGIAMAPIFPAMVSTTSQRVGKLHSTNAVGVQMAFAGLGVGIIPTIAGLVSAQWGIERLPYLLLSILGIFVVILWISKLLSPIATNIEIFQP